MHGTSGPLANGGGLSANGTVVPLTFHHQHPVIDMLIAVIVFAVALSVIGSAIWLAVTTSRRNRKRGV